MSGNDPTRPPASAGRALVGCCAGLAFAVLTADVVGYGPVTRRELNTVRRRTGVAAPWTLVTTLGGRPALAAMTAVASLAAAARGRSRSAVLPLVATVAIGTSVRWVLSRAIDRKRPATERWLVSVDGPSYPSRHATAATLGALVLYRSLPRSALLTSALAAGVAAVGVSRVRLGVHWPSDVLAGIALATAADAVIWSVTGSSGQPRVQVPERRGNR
jgi:membrane-associated phospholipid phosphatase